MKTTQCICVLLFLACNLAAQERPKTAFWKKVLSATPPPEMPVLAAKWIKESAVPDRATVTVGVVDAAVEINPAAATLVVGAISRAVPEMAAVAATTAGAKQPAQAAAICKAATAMAPAMAANIVGAMCKAVPGLYRSVAVAASEAAPGAGKEILRAVATATPATRPYLDQQIARYDRGLPPVALILDPVRMAQTNALGVGFSQSPQPVSLPLSLNSNDQHPKSGGNGWHGGRNYAKP